MFSGDNRRPFMLGIDVGHGGGDPGAVCEGIREKDINLKIAKDLFFLISHFQFNIHACFTRLKSRNLSLRDRGTMFNNRDLDLVISLHCNAAENALASKALTFIYPGNRESNLIGARLLHNLPWELRPDKCHAIEVSSKGWTRRAFNVVSAFKASTVLFEMGFISNKDDRDFMTSSRGRYAICNSILKTVTDYAHENEQSSHP